MLKSYKWKKWLDIFDISMRTNKIILDTSLRTIKIILALSIFSNCLKVAKVNRCLKMALYIIIYIGII